MEKCQQKQKAAHDGKRSLPTFVKEEKVLVLNTQGKTKWLSGTIVEQKSPVTYLVKVGPRTRYCHADHLLQSGGVNISDRSDVDVALELALPPTESEVTNSLPESESISVPLRCSTREIRAPHRLIKEL